VVGSYPQKRLQFLLFNPERYTASKAHIAIYKIYQYIYTMVDFYSALMFIVGSIFYFYVGVNRMYLY